VRRIFRQFAIPRYDRWLNSLVAGRCHFPHISFFLVLFLLCLSRVWSIGNLSMADVSDPKIQEGSFPNNVPTLGRNTNPNSVFS